MKDKLLVIAASVVLLAAGAGLGTLAIWEHSRIGALENTQAQTLNDLNQKVLPEIKKQFDELKAAQAPAPAAKVAKKG